MISWAFKDSVLTFFVLALGLLSGCKTPEEHHAVVCYDMNSEGQLTTTNFQGEAVGNIYVVMKNSVTYITFIDANKERIIINTTNKSCGFN